VNLHHLLQAIVTVLAVINPMVCGSIFLSLTPNVDRASQRRLASKVFIGILVILGASALAGQAVLQALGISLEVFEVVGGVIIAYMGFNMLGGGSAFRPPTSKGEQDTNVQLTPLMMFAAGPGTIAAVVTLAAAHASDGSPSTAIIASIVGAMVTFAALLLAIQVGGRLGESAAGGVTRFMGLIVASMGMQFILVGLKAFFQTRTG
jgi:multiple antibiotic resistance protein